MQSASEERKKELREHFSISHMGFLFSESAERFRLTLVAELPDEALPPPPHPRRRFAGHGLGAGPKAA